MKLMSEIKSALGFSAGEEPEILNLAKLPWPRENIVKQH